MRKVQQEQKTDIKTSLVGVGIIVLSLACFLIFLEFIVVVIRFLLG